MKTVKTLELIILGLLLSRSASWRLGLIGAAMGFLLLGAVSNLNAQGNQSFIPTTINEFKSTRAPGQAALQTTFMVPANVTRILAQLWGAGGGGGSVSSNSRLEAGGDGGVGAYSCKVLTVTAGSILVITLGTGGQRALSSTNSGFTGGNSSIVIQNSSTLLTAGGGHGGSSSGADGAAGTPDPTAQIGRGANVLPEPFRFGQTGLEPFYRDFPPQGGSGGLGVKAPAVAGIGGNGYAVFQF